MTNEKFNLKQILKFFTALKLITLKSPAFLRAKNLKPKINLKKGYPIGVFKTFRKTYQTNFLNIVKWEILPLLDKNWNFNKNFQTTINIDIKNVFLFNNLKPFYFKFKNLPKIRIEFVFSKVSNKLIYFLLRFYQIPFNFNKNNLK